MERRAGKEKLKNILYPVLSLAVFLLVWYAAAAATGMEIILPTPWAAVRSFFTLFITPPFWQAVGMSLLRVAESFLVSFALALVLAVLARLVRPVAKLLEPLLVIVRATPTMSVILLALIWFSSRRAPLFIAGLIVFPLLYAAMYAALSSADADIVEMSKVYRVPRRDMVRLFYVPYMLPQLFAAVKSSIGLTVKLIIAAEALAQTGMSIGNMMQVSKIYFNTAELLGWTIAAILLSAGLEALVSLVRRVTLKWEGRP